MATGDTKIINGVEYEVVWNGEEGLIEGDRATKPHDLWTPPHRLYTKKSDYWSRIQSKPDVLDKPAETDDDVDEFKLDAELREREDALGPTLRELINEILAEEDDL